MSNFTKKQTKKNIFFASFQVLISGISLFILYKVLIVEIGIELIGVWSIIMAFTAFLRTGDFGFAGSIVKFVSENVINNNFEKAHNIIKVSLTYTSILLGFLLIIAYLIIYFLLPYFIDKEYLEKAIELLPYSIISSWLLVLSTITIFVFDGLNRVDIRSSFLIFSNLFLVVLSISFVYLYGFIGLGYSQLIYAVIQLLIAWVLVRKYLKIRNIIPFSLDMKIFKEMFTYSANLQLTNLLSLLVEPISKILLGYFGTMSSVGYFEMANRFVMQARNIIVSANQAVVPMIVNTFVKNNSRMHENYIFNLKILFFVSLIAYLSLIFLTHFISIILIGYAEDTFIYFSYIIIVTMFINTLSGAAYFSNQGMGNVIFNTYSHIIMSVINIILGIFLGYVFYDYGVVIAYAISISFASIWLMINFNSRIKYND